MLRNMGVKEMGNLLREKRGALTQEDLEERTGVSQGMISRLERGEIQRPNLDFVRSIADAVETPYEDFVSALHGVIPVTGERPAALANTGGVFRELTDDEMSQVEDFAQFIRDKRKNQ